MGLLSKLLKNNVEEENEYSIMDSQIDLEFIALYNATNDFVNLVHGRINKNPNTILDKFLIECLDANKILFGKNDKANVTNIDMMVAAIALVIHNGDPSDEDFDEIYNGIVLPSMSAALGGKKIKVYASFNALIATLGLKGMIDSI